MTLGGSPLRRYKNIKSHCVHGKINYLPIIISEDIHIKTYEESKYIS